MKRTIDLGRVVGANIDDSAPSNKMTYSSEKIEELNRAKLSSDGTAADSAKLSGKSLAEIMLEAYPVGSIYMSVNDTSPASLFGGTWEQLKDRFLLGAGGSYASGDTGGSASKKISYKEIPPLEVSILFETGSDWGTISKTDAWAMYWNDPDIQQAPEGGASGNFARWGMANYRNLSQTAFDKMPPYLAVNIWKRVS